MYYVVWGGVDRRHPVSKDRYILHGGERWGSRGHEFQIRYKLPHKGTCKRLTVNSMLQIIIILSTNRIGTKGGHSYNVPCKAYSVIDDTQINASFRF